MKTLTLILLTAMLNMVVPEGGRASETKDRLGKRQLAALLAAVEAMHRHGYSFRGQQVVIHDAADSFEITFMDDPIDVAVAGGQHAHGWVVRKRDARVLREFLVR